METQTANSRSKTKRIWWMVALVVAGLALFLAFVFDAAAQEWLSIHQNHALKSFMRNVSTFGDWPEHVVIGAILVALAIWRGSRKWQRVFLAMLIACALAGVVARVIKIGTGRARPSVKTEAVWSGPRLNSKYNAFPSGHTAASTAFFATLAFASWRIGSAFLLVPLLIAFSRMYVAAHYLSDVVGAGLLGVVCAFVTVHWLFGFEDDEVATAAGE